MISVFLLLLVFLGISMGFWCLSKKPRKYSATQAMREALKLAPRLGTLGSTVDIPVFYINLDRSVKRKERMEAHLKEIRVKNFQRVAGIDGRKLSETGSISPDEDWWAASLPRGFSHLADILGCQRHMVGEVGCSLSHLKALVHALRSTTPGEPVLILEDDADLSTEARWPCSLRELASQAPPGWGAVSLCDYKVRPKSAETATFYPLDPQVTESTCAYMVSSLGLERLARALQRPAEFLKVLQACAADRLVYALLGTCYGHSFPFVVPYNDYEDHNSLIHPDHTARHMACAEERLQVLLA